ncbi:hypothetical protein WICANDRAFT_60373 [Wickerhamomyces anomalus NRRL Y-366-8]|uniref:Sm domain-containing protein n=1 Tax=Wickerhamomyces anomalus (strain ATCC 58044 / CBS 1984 / NCYC 433 / NRRL Y-366-8) TaxID=683960 RepID=A0A1E3PA67_WICAA|nr:uncharacterized protein WICANDRAFT_60373 [Wickerhamomyces anomalus NRRL Y-366-8]ODQ62309.1 hypothetical protein WICANDRAFT_60373 [Wickerhamomyces anomalus NRRL Y-366-8]
MSEVTTTTISAPSKFISDISGAKVIVKLYSGEEYHGTLDSIDGYMNITLEETQEIVSNKVTRKYGDVFIRGNNVLYISQA